MKNAKWIKLAIATTLFCSLNVLASTGKKVNPKADIDTLGGNQEIMDMAQNIKSTSRSRIVQNRIIDRNMALEMGLTFGNVFGGDSYLRTQSLGASLDFHINPRWSLGARYYDYGSSLTPEGERISSKARNTPAGGTSNSFDIDTPQNSVMAVINWYPIYGKTSFLDIGVTQFDLYVLAGGGQMNLSSGSTPVYTGGIGLGAWLSKHVTARAEIRYQTYQDQLSDGSPQLISRNLDTVVGTVGFGWLL